MSRKSWAITILVDPVNDWTHSYAKELTACLKQMGHVAKLRFSPRTGSGELMFLFGYTKKVTSAELSRHRHNLVVHASDLPRGRGWAPISWQVLEGKKRIPVTLFEATETFDGGDVYMKGEIRLKGTELNAEIRAAQADSFIRMVLSFVHNYPIVKPRAQRGRPSYYRRRTREDSRLDVQKSFAAQFDLLRIADNMRYPAYFDHRGRRYVVHVHPGDDYHFEKKAGAKRR